MEIFRAVTVDAPTLKLARRKQLHMIDEDSPWLDDPTKKLLVSEIKSRLEKKFTYGGSQHTLNSIITQEAWNIARSMSSENPVEFWRWGR